MCVLKRPYDKKDVFGAFLVKNASFSKGIYDMPIVSSNISALPKTLIPYNTSLNKKSVVKSTAALHFYVYDYLFDGRFGVWNTLISGTEYKKGFCLKRLEDYGCLIAPDYSLYLDMPVEWQIWNTYRNRIVTFALQELGYSVIPSVRWSDTKSFAFCFEGIKQNSIVSVGSYGCSKTIADKLLFEIGLEELIKRLNPSTILFYGSLSNKCKEILSEHQQKHLLFKPNVAPTQTGRIIRGEGVLSWE